MTGSCITPGTPTRCPRPTGLGAFHARSLIYSATFGAFMAVRTTASIIPAGRGAALLLDGRRERKGGNESGPSAISLVAPFSGGGFVAQTTS